MYYIFIEVVCFGILVNLMVCLVVWMSYLGCSLMDKVFIMVLFVVMFVVSGFEYSIVNMFMIFMGIVICDFVILEFWIVVGLFLESFFYLIVMSFIIDNLILVMIGNIIGGGLLVGLIYWVIYLCGNEYY